MDFDQIYTRYFNDVYLYLLRLSGDPHTAEEITSDTFYKALQAIDSFRGECDLRVWLCQIAKNIYFTQLKRNRHHTSMDDLQVSSEPSDILLENLLIDKENAERVRTLLHRIPEPYKEVFMWRVFAELSFRQIGQIFNKSDNWACVTYHRARKMIQQSLEEIDHEK